MVEALGATARLEPSVEPITQELIREALVSLWGNYDRVNGGFGRAPKFPQALGDRVAARARRARDVARDAARRWPAAGSTTRSAAASRATRSTRPGPSRTSRRCSTTTRCWPAPTCTAGRSPARSGSSGCASRRSIGRCARCAVPRAASARRSTRTPRASRASSTCGRWRSCVRRSESWAPTSPRKRSRTSARASAATSRDRDATCSRRAVRSRRRCPRSAGVLLAARSERVRPGLDDKRLTSWNALMISALAEAGAVLARSDYLDAAVACASFVLRDLRDGDGRLLRSWKDGRAPARRLPRGPRVPARGAARPCTRRPSIRAGTARRSRSPTR